MENPNDQSKHENEMEDTFSFKISRNAKETFHYSIIVLLGIVLIQNTQNVEFNFILWKISISKIILLPIFFLLGYLFIRFNVLSIISKNKK